MDKKYLKLPNGNILEFFDKTINSVTCMFSFVDTNIDAIEDFFGESIIDYVDVLDSEYTLKENIKLHLKYSQSIVSKKTIQEKSYRKVSEAFDEIIPPVLDEFGEIIIGETIVHHKAVYEEVYTDVQVKMTQVYLEKPDVNEEVKTLKQVVGIVDTNNMSVEEFKNYYINLSKVKLAEYLETHPLVSTCHNNVEGVYAITKEKQDLMMQNYSTYAIKKQMGVEAALTWNETGDVCEVWQESEFLQLISETESVVKPLVTKQQSLEKEIKLCTSINSIKGISLDYSVADIRNKTE